MDDLNICCYKKCKEKAEIAYYGKPLCDKHWLKLSEKTPEEIKEILGIKSNEKKNEREKEKA
jgi:hypothetical protein